MSSISRAQATMRGGKRSVKNGAFLFVVLLLILLSALWSYMLITAGVHRTLDQRVNDIALQMKCPVCQGESVADSPSVLAQQMRAVIRQQLQAGRSDQQVIQYFEDSYGEQIIWSPPWRGFTLLAWLVPMVLFLGGFVLLFFVFRDWRRMTPAHTTVDEGEHAAATPDKGELEYYREQLEHELASEDVLFQTRKREIR